MAVQRYFYVGLLMNTNNIVLTQSSFVYTIKIAQSLHGYTVMYIRESYILLEQFPPEYNNLRRMKAVTVFEENFGSGARGGGVGRAGGGAGSS